MAVSWIEVKAKFSPVPEDWSPIVEAFRVHGIENTLEDGEHLSGCLVDVDGSVAVLDELRAALNDLGAAEISMRPLEEENWEVAWRQFFKPRRVGKQFVVRPTWEDFDALPGDRVITLDPGQAFGTGDHPTTRMCLELLEEIPVEGQRVLDLGCGSGILAVGACLLGAREVHAIDIDPLAVEVAKENAKVNQVSFVAVAGDGVGALTGGKVNTDPDSVPQDETPLSGDLSPLAVTEKAGHEPYDLVLSNIISATLIRLAPEIRELVKPDSHWIVSGIIDQNWPDVLAASERADFELESMIGEDGWVAARLRRKAS